MTSANELAALADWLKYTQDTNKGLAHIPEMAKHIEDLKKWESLVRATSAAGVREELEEIWCLREVIRGVRIMDNMGAFKDYEDEPWLKRVRNIDIDTGFSRDAIPMSPKIEGYKRTQKITGKIVYSDESLFKSTFNEKYWDEKPLYAFPTNSEWNAAVEACAEMIDGFADCYDAVSFYSNVDGQVAATRAKEQAASEIAAAIRSLHRGEAQRTDGGVEGHADLQGSGHRSKAGGNVGAKAMTEAGIKPGPSDTAPPRWRHKKRGTTYTEIGRGPLQASTRQPAEDDVIVCYQGEDGRLFFREASEFEDGRFERVTAPQTDGGEEQ